MIWGSLIVGLSIAMLMPTNLLIGQYTMLAVVAYTLFGLGLAFYATPSTDAALSNLPDDQAGSGSGIYKMASSLGASFGVAISAAIFTALSADSEIDSVAGGRDHVCRSSGQRRRPPGGADRVGVQSAHGRGGRSCRSCSPYPKTARRQSRDRSPAQQTRPARSRSIVRGARAVLTRRAAWIRAVRALVLHVAVAPVDLYL